MAEAAPGVRYARFVGLSAAVVVGIFVIGFVPTRRLAGNDAISGMVTGCVAGFLAATMAGVLLVVMRAETPTARMQRAFLAMVVRLAVAAVLGLAAVLSGEFSRTPLLFWLATTYVVLLPLEVRLAITSE